MVRNPIADTNLAGLRPLGIAGQRVLDSWEQIDSYLRSSTNPSLANLFAEPMAHPGGRITWFGPDGGTVKSFADLSADEQAALRTALSDKVAEIEGFATPLAASSNPTARLVGENLLRALILPGDIEKNLFAVDGEPVLINWGTEPEGERPAQDPLKEFMRPPAAVAAVPPPPPEAAANLPPDLPVAPLADGPAPTGDRGAAVPPPVTHLQTVVVHHHFPWWTLLWLLFALLLGWIFYVLILGCGMWSGLGLFNRCPAPPIAITAPAPPEATLTDQLLIELAALEQRLQQVPRCPPVAEVAPEPVAPPVAEPEPAPAPEPPPQPEPNEFQQRIQESGAEEGELTITLIWDSRSDLDLHVTCPNGQEIFFRRKTRCGGELDVDANAEQMRDKPVENIFFRSPAPGTYRVEVNNFDARGIPRNKFQVRVKKGQSEQVYDGQLGLSGRVSVIDVTIP